MFGQTKTLPMKIGIVGNQEEIKTSKEIIQHFTKWLFVNCFDTHENESQHHVLDFNDKLYKSFLQSVDVVIISASVKNKYSIARKALRSSKHVYVQHPVYFNPEKLNHLIQLANEANTVLKFQQSFKHLSVFKHLKKLSRSTQYISIIKSAFPDVKKDFQLIDQLLRTDLELLFEITQTNIKKITPHFLPSSKGNGPYMINCRIEFENGTLAHIEFQPQHSQPIHQVNVYSQSQLYHIDFIENYVTRAIYNTVDKEVIPFSFEDNKFIWTADLTIFNDLISKKQVSIPFEFESYKPIFAISNLIDEYEVS